MKIKKLGPGEIVTDKLTKKKLIIVKAFGNNEPYGEFSCRYFNEVTGRFEFIRIFRAEIVEGDVEK